MLSIGYQGGTSKGQIYWHAAEQLWAFLSPDYLPRSYWFCFGAVNPSTTALLSITCEINVPREGIDRRRAGALVKDDTGRIYLTHTGMVGGGRAGIGKAAFLAYYQSAERKSVLWPDGQETRVVIVAAVDAPDLVNQIARFVHTVAAFKKQVVGR